MSTTSRPTTTPNSNIVADIEAIGQAYTSTKVKTPNAYYKD
jgi:hypothetical protein